MPELPEVEIIKLFLEGNITGLAVESVQILNKKSFSGDPELLSGKKIKKVSRRAKILRIEIEEFELLIHLKMSGQLIWKNSESGIKKQANFIGGHPTHDMFGDLPNKSTRVIFNLSDGSKLFFNDQRKFGWIKLVSHGSGIGGHEFFDKLGPEPLGDDFTWQILRGRMQRRKNSAIKAALLDQGIVAGIGNIYACEACFLAGLHPGRKTGELKIKDWEKLHAGIIESLNNGIKYGGSSKTHFFSPEGKKGLFLDYAFVYGREGLPCKKCGTLIEKIRLGGRGTFFCPKCQVD